ncbi:hypothetical protein LCGC14_0164180 [marine sediment metagenome]|uniref:Uncharacterized protein n=1 Tax=marine sediment metagenome TaxID=412755 RepID=A0A0F9UYI9_9ZZZZ
MTLNGEARGIADLHRCQIQGYLKAVKATLYSLEEDCSLFKHMPKTHIQIGNLLSQLGHVMAECDDEFLTQAR